jgi:hypothetical protein
MATNAVSYTASGRWRVEIDAFKVNALVYKAIGATVRVKSKETVRTGLFGWGGTREDWVERPARYITIDAAFKGVLGSNPGVSNRECGTTSESSCDCRLWSVGFSISADATANSGLPDPDTAGVGPGPSLNVRSVEAIGRAMIGQELITVGPVDTGL